MCPPKRYAACSPCAKVRIEQSLQEEAAHLKVVETRLRQLERSQTSEREDVVLKSVPAQPFLSFRETYTDVFDAVATVMELSEVIPRRFGKRAGHLTAVMHGEAFEMENVDIEMGYVLTRSAEQSFRLPSGRVLTPSELPALPTAACSVRVGGFEKGYLNYSDLGIWLEANNHAMLTPHREVMIVPPLPQQMDETVVEIQLPIAEV